MCAITEKKPPSPRPECTGAAVSGLWDLFGKCWSITPADRPSAGTICEYLEGQDQLVTELETHVDLSLWNPQSIPDDRV